MKKGIIALTLVFLLFVIACEEANLPTSPKAPGRQGPLLGRAVEGLHAFPDWAARPKNMFVYPEDIGYQEFLRAKILEYDFIYRFGYYFNTRSSIWEMFELADGKKLKDWYIGKTAKADIKITRDTFDIGENYVVLYGCNKLDEGFECNDNQWMLTFFRVLPEEPYSNWVSEDDESDFVFLSSKKEQRTFSGERVMTYTAEYVKDNDKAIVEITEVETMSAAKAILAPWSLFIQNYKAYGTNYLSSYDIDDEYYNMWMSDNITVRIFFEGNETPKDLVDAYLAMWPGTEIDFESGTIVPGIVDQQEVCGNFVIADNERCDPPNSDCLTEAFSVFEVSKGNYHYVDGHEIIVNDIGTNEAVIIVDGIYKLIPEGEIEQFSNKGYIHVLRILGTTVRMAFGYQMGTCTDACRCTISGEAATGGYCGNNEVELELGEECESPGEICEAGSGLSSICSDDCACPEPLGALFTYCGDGAVQTPNSMRLLEQCEKPGNQCNVGTVTGWCSPNCQCVPIGTVPQGCGDYYVDKPGEACDPPGIGCVKNSAIGICNADCGCDVFISQPTDLTELTKALCNGVEEPPCYGVDEECDETGICNVDCECESGQEVTGGEVCESGESCDYYELTYIPTPGQCSPDGKNCIPDYNCDCTDDIDQEEKMIILTDIVPLCKQGNCPINFRLETHEGIDILIEEQETEGGIIETKYAISSGMLLNVMEKCICMSGEEELKGGDLCGTESEECDPVVTPICQEDLQEGETIIRKTGPCTEQCICEFTESEIILPDNCYDCPEDDNWHTCVQTWLETLESAENCLIEGERCGLPQLSYDLWCTEIFPTPPEEDAQGCFVCDPELPPEEWHTCAQYWLSWQESAEECISEGIRCGLPQVYCENFCNEEFGEGGDSPIISAAIIDNELVTEKGDGVSIFAMILVVLAIGGIVAVNFIKKD